LEVVGAVKLGPGHEFDKHSPQPRVNGGLIKRDMEVRDDRDVTNKVRVHAATTQEETDIFSISSSIYVRIWLNGSAIVMAFAYYQHLIKYGLVSSPS